MARGIGALFLGAAVMSLFVPAPKGAAIKIGRGRRTKSSGMQPRAAEPALPARMLALVQTRPHTLVLAVSESREELEREMAELNETWNHWQIRTERQRYEIQPAPVLRRVSSHEHAGRARLASRGASV